MADVEAQNPSAVGSDIISFFQKPNLAVTLKFEDVVYKVKIPKTSEEKTILKGISGIVHPGEMLAMLGPSGSGKTTLLTSLGGRLSTGHLTGSTTYNNKPFSNSMKRNTGFVTQDDVLYPHLTVSETLVYTALLRLPRSLTAAEKTRHADAVIAQLGLSRCRHSIVGGPFLRGVSGGERKRVSIGQEMLINPSLLFLDEPTSGLDSTTAQKIVHTLWELANGGRTIVMTIHQPSSRLFYMFHKLLLLSEGSPLYFGKGSAALDYFSSVGFPLPSVAMNPSDFLLDLANGVSTGDPNEDGAAIKQTLVSAYAASGRRLSEEVASYDEECDDQNNNNIKVDKWSNTWWVQFSVLFRRGIKERKHESLSALRIVQVLFVAVLSGLLWWQTDARHLLDQVGLLFFYNEFWGFYSMLQAIFMFPQERMMLAKERSSGMYRLSSYFMALTLGDLPMELVLPTVFFTMTYWMAGLKATAGSFFTGLFVLLYSVLCYQGMGLAIGAAVMDQKSAITLGTVVMLAFILASGFFVQNVPAFISWIKYIATSQYAFKLLLRSQYEPGETYPCGENTCLVEDIPSVKVVGLGGQVIAVIVLAVMIVGYRLIAYLALMRIGANKR